MTDHPAAPESAHPRLLASVLDELIPARPDADLPAAGQLDLAGAVEAALRTAPMLHAMAVEGLKDLDDAARRRFGRGFPDLNGADKVTLLGEQGFVLPLTLHAYIAYYQHPRVVSALGLEPRPPHPQGYEVEPSDLTLLDPVRARPTLYRRC